MLKGFSKLFNKEEVEVITFPSEFINQVSPEIIVVYNKLKNKKKESFNQAFLPHSKNYKYTFLFSLVGCHYGHLNRWGVQIFFWFTCGGVMLWYFIDLFRSKNLTIKYNTNLALRTIKALNQNWFGSMREDAEDDVFNDNVF